MKEFLRVEQVAKLACCSRRHVMEEIKRKNIRAYKPGRLLLFDPVEVDKWIKRKAVS